MDLIFDPSVMLYLPLWQRDRAAFMSDDAYGHLATVTGALWTPQGIQCDGIDDVIHIPDQASLKFGTGDWTASIWVKTSQVAAGGVYPILFSKDDELATRRGWAIYQVSDSNKVAFSVMGDTVRELQSINAINDGSFHLLTLVKGAVNFEGFIDNVSQGTNTNPVGTTDKAIQVNIGGNGNANRWSSGLFGEAWLQNKAVRSPERDNQYLGTKWRYQ